MLYAIGRNKIIRADDDGNTVAEVHFEEVEDHVYEITEVLTASTDSNDPNLDKLMAKMVSTMRKNGNRVLTHDEFATEWFEDHPEARDILTTSARADKASRRASREASRRQQSDAASSQQRRKADSRADRTQTTRQAADRRRTSDRAYTTERVSDEDDNGLTSADIPGRALRSFSRILQILCAVVMLAILIVFVYVWSQNANTQAQLLQDTTQGLAAFRAACYGFMGFAVLMFLWILSRRTYRVDGERLRMDTGRGMIAFAIILIAVILGPTCLSYASSAAAQARAHYDIIRGLAGFFSIYLVDSNYIGMLSIAGLLMSIVRQFIGH